MNKLPDVWLWLGICKSCARFNLYMPHGRPACRDRSGLNIVIKAGYNMPADCDRALEHIMEDTRRGVLRKLCLHKR